MGPVRLNVIVNIPRAGGRSPATGRGLGPAASYTYIIIYLRIYQRYSQLCKDRKSVEVLFSLSFNREKSGYEVFYAIGYCTFNEIVRLRKSEVPYTEWILMLPAGKVLLVCLIFF